MKTRRLATALEKGSVDDRRDHAAGLVSRMTVKREGDCSGRGLLVSLVRKKIVVVG